MRVCQFRHTCEYKNFCGVRVEATGFFSYTEGVFLAWLCGFGEYSIQKAIGQVLFSEILFSKGRLITCEINFKITADKTVANTNKTVAKGKGNFS